MFRNIHKILVRKSEGGKPFEVPRRWWEDGIKMCLKQIAYEDRDWIHLAYNGA
jgi:hypothetical protein